MLKLPENTLTRFTLLFATLSLAACGGSSSSSTTITSLNPPEDTSSGNDDFQGTEVQDYLVGVNPILKAGVYTAVVSYTDGRDDLVGPMLLSATGNFTFPFGADFITSGTLNLEGSDEQGADIGGPVVEYELFDTWSRTTGTIVGIVEPDLNESAVLDTGAQVDGINITRNNDASDENLSFDQQIAGRYETTGSDAQIDIDVEGRIDGFDRGCILEGQITIPVPEINIYELSYEASGCTNLAEATAEERNGDYLGVGTFIPAAGDEGIKFAASNGKIAFFFSGTK